MWAILLLAVFLLWAPLVAAYAFLAASISSAVQEIKNVVFPPSRETRRLRDAFINATTYKQWVSAGRQLDTLDASKMAWKNEDAYGTVYHWHGIHRRVEDLGQIMKDGDVTELSFRVGQFPVRNYCNILDPRLFNHLHVGTKGLVEEFVKTSVEAIQTVAEHPPEPKKYLGESVIFEAIKSPRVATGKTALMFQAGSIFGLCHFGVIKELLERDLLPSIVVGNKSGAFAAALVGVFKNDELCGILSHGGLDLSAFARKDESRWPVSFLQRLLRFLKHGYVLDQQALAKCVRANIGDITFEEAYYKTRRPLNITIACGVRGVPGLLNHMTTPNIVIWTAAVASSETDQIKAFSLIQTKNEDGLIEPWDIGIDLKNRPRKTWTPGSWLHNKASPLSRMRELFKVNHFIISQARPFVAPLLTPSFERPYHPKRQDRTWTEFAVDLLSMEVQHRIFQMKRLGIAPAWALRFMADETFEGLAVRPRGHKQSEALTLVPEVVIPDFLRLLRDPSPEELEYWMLRGQRSVWPAVAALEVRCRIEKTLEAHYQILKARNPYDFDSTPVLTPPSMRGRDSVDEPDVIKIPAGIVEGDDIVEGEFKNQSLSSTE